MCQLNPSKLKKKGNRCTRKQDVETPNGDFMDRMMLKDVMYPFGHKALDCFAPDLMVKCLRLGRCSRPLLNYSENHRAISLHGSGFSFPAVVNLT